MPVYEHLCENCGYFWEDLFKLNDPIPPCEQCKSTNVKRVMSLCAGRMDEPLNKETIAKLRADGKRLAKKAEKDENLRANIIGEDKYHKSQLT